MSAVSIFGRVPVDFRVNYLEHDGQAEVSDALEANLYSENPAAIIEIIASRGWGKTLYLACAILAPYLEQHANARVMWVAPTYQVGMTLIDDVFKGVNEETGQQYIPEFDSQGNRIWEFVTTKSGPVLKWWNGATVSIKSADSPDSIVSKGFNLIIIDEAALIQEQVFTQQIMGTARKKGIKIFMITTPRGKRHWTYKYFLKGQDPKDADVISFQQPYTKNPYFSPTLAKLIKDLPDWLYRQEYLAEFVEDGDSVIRGIDHVLFGSEIAFEDQQQEWALPIENVTIKTPNGDVVRQASQRTFVAAMDLAKSVDYTVITVMDIETGQIVYYKRMNKEDYRVVLDKAAQVCRQYNNADLIFDATGVGQGLGDVLHNYDVVSHPFVFTNESKVEAINKLIVSIEYQEIQIPNIVTIKNELAVYTYSLTRTGKVSYNAPPGFHDDIVISIALANWYRKENMGTDTIGVIDEIISINRGSSGRKSFIDEMYEDND